MEPGPGWSVGFGLDQSLRVHAGGSQYDACMFWLRLAYVHNQADPYIGESDVVGRLLPFSIRSNLYMHSRAHTSTTAFFTLLLQH